ncbi:MAG TPA: hypothetical protein PLY00_15665, partial [Verrucomicrobiota bacterium]|nr:hypothetical protein [Verrucomicrobiota bacterium]HOR72698.1 hypothetical protein [Verrucomicrobiota bacterium]HOU89026.1 hypothetical protein [Verrucomicrobiota bacterium]HPV09955.1 hypothetical protein [Verrucomicrobiota bacterium]HQI34159.1 hypothetical protein [Verrucomicrobiota bacterium]
PTEIRECSLSHPQILLQSQVYEPMPKWRRGAKRPSCLDLVTLLRKQLADHPVTFPTAKAPATYPMMVGSAAA